jgi:hypothetical protein
MFVARRRRPADRLQTGRRGRGRSRAVCHVALERPRAGCVVQPEPPGTHLPTRGHYRTVSIQRLLCGATRASGRSRHVQPGTREGIADRRPWTLAELYALPQISQITRHICIEGWSAIGQWSGVRFSDFLARIGADTKSRFVAFRCADDYTSSIDMPTALHPQTLLAFRFRDQILPTRYGFPMKLRVPTKLGFKIPKHIVAISITNEDPGGFWEKYGYNHFSGL